MKTIIIDGNNLIHKVSYLKIAFYENPENAQLSLIESVLSKHKSKDKLIFVFDGFGKSTNKNVIFSGKVSADEIIRKYIEDNYNKKLITVVSSDGEIMRLAKICSCDAIKVEDFWTYLSKVPGGKPIETPKFKEPEKQEHMSKKELEEFKKYFS
jgi:predicted RNA-binding protein with PIN domain